MKLKIIVDNDLEEYHGKISSITFDKLPSDKRPKLKENDYFHLMAPKYIQVIIQIDRNILEDENNLYLHETGKDLLYGATDFIEF